ncbi:MAG: FtsX-like permease family protein [Deltaproteobacteria bacterium]
MLKIGFWTKTAFFFLTRSGRSTLLLSFMVLVSVSALVFLSSMAVGINDAMVRNSVSLYSGHVTGIDLPPSVTPEDLMVDGVAGVLKSERSAGIFSAGARRMPAVVVAVDPASETGFTALAKKQIEGSYPEQGSRSVYLSAYLAENLMAHAGDSVDLSFEREVVRGLLVSGVYKTGVDAIDRSMAFVPSGVVGNGGDKAGYWHAAVFLEDGVDPDRIIAEYSHLADGELSFKSWAELMPDLKELIDLNYVSMSIVMVIVFAVVAIGISSSFGIFILRHMREYGLMKAMGVTGRELTLLITLEVVLMNSVATSAGAAIGAVATCVAAGVGIDLSAFTSHNRYFSVSGVIYPRLTVYSVLIPVALSLSFGLIAALWPASMAARKKVADILRSN